MSHLVIKDLEFCQLNHPDKSQLQGSFVAIDVESLVEAIVIAPDLVGTAIASSFSASVGNQPFISNRVGIIF